MTKKDYILIANVFNKVYRTHPLDDDIERYRVWSNCVSTMCGALASDNPNFNRLLFQKACLKK